MEKTLEIIKLEDVINTCLSYHNQEITREEFQEFMNKIYIKKYLPISTKSLLINYILLSDDFLGIIEESVLSIEIELKKFYRIMLAYTNISTENSDNLMTMTNYDLLMMYLGDIIEDFCKNDYNRTISMLENTINFANINNLMEQKSLILTDSKDINDELKEAFKTLESHKDIINKVIDVVKFNKPTMEDINLKIKK